MIERTIAWLTHRNRRLRYRGVSTTPAGPGTASTDANQQKPKPSTTLTTGSGCTLITRNEVCMKPGMLQY